jgi:hypothetical protein
MPTRVWTLIGILGFIAASADAAEIWTNVYLDYVSSIAKFDSDNPGTFIPVGPTGVGNLMDGMDFTTDGTLYGVMDQYLFIIDHETGGATQLGGALLPDPNEIFFDLSWDPSTDTMYAIGAVLGDKPKLYQIDLEHLKATFVGRIYDYTDFLPPGGLATTATGERYTDGATHVWGLGPPEDGNDPWVPTWQLPFPEGPSNFLFSGMTIDWSRDGVCYHATLNRNAGPDPRTELWTVDLDSGRGHKVGDIGALETLLFSVAIKPVPEPGGLLTLVALAACVRRRGA